VNIRPAKDTTPPVIQSVTALTPDAYTLSLSVAVSEPSAITVEFGRGSFQCRTNPTGLVTSANVSLGFFAPGALLQYRVIAADAAGNITVGPTQTVKTPALTFTVSRD